MKFRALLRPRPVILMLIWLLPTLFYLTIGAVALYQTGWLGVVALTLPLVWLCSWLVARFWPPTTAERVADGQRLYAEKHWTPQDISAISIIEDYRNQIAPLRFEDLLHSDRYLHDVTELAKRLTNHYFDREDEIVVGNVTLIELLAVIHLAAADIEDWVAANVPGSKLVKIKTLSQAPAAAKSVEWVQNAGFLFSAIANPTKLMSYPIWKMSGRVFTELRHELLQSVYQQFLRQIGFYLIEIYSGRLRGGSHVYEQHFRRTSTAIFDRSKLTSSTINDRPVQEPNKSENFTPPGLSSVGDVNIAIMGQVKAGKSSLLNHLLREQVAVTSVLPETRVVSMHTLEVPGIGAKVRLLDTPGYSEDGAKRQQLDAIRSAAENAQILILVISAVSPARQADADLLSHLQTYYEKEKHLQPPPIIAVLTHIDQLSPRREWSPPYHWHKPKTPKEKSIADAAAYVQESLGSSIREVVCVYSGEASLAADPNKSDPESPVLDAMVPVIARLLPEGQSAAILCAYHRQLSQRKLGEILNQISGLGRKLVKLMMESKSS